MQSTMHAYEVRPREDKRAVDLISDVLPFGRLWYGEPNAINNAMHSSRSHDAVIHVYDEAGNVSARDIASRFSGSTTDSIYCVNRAITALMLRRITVSGAIVIALFAATVRLPAVPCIITNTASEQPCAPGCCANKTWCVTSHQRTGSAAQPLAKTTSDQQNIATLSVSIAIPLAIQPVAKSSVYSSVESASVSVPRLALLCTFLI